MGECQDNNCRKFVIANLVGIVVWWYECATSWCDLDLTFDLGIVTFSVKSLSGRTIGNSKMYKIYNCQLAIDIRLGVKCATSWCNLDVTFDLVVVTLNVKILHLQTVRCRKAIHGMDISWVV